MSLIALEDARLRGITLPADDGAAQDIIDEQEAWLAQRIGLLVGERVQTFYVGVSQSHGRLGLARYTDAVAITDGGVALDAGHVRLVARGSAVVLSYSAPSRYWTGPYTVVTYTPNDEDVVRKAIFDLVALAAQPVGPYESEQIGSYSYRRGGAPGTLGLTAQRAQIASALLPVHDALLTLRSTRPVGAGDPVINRPEVPL